MKKILVTLCFLGITGTALLANEPVINVTAPSGTLFVNSFPYSAPITFSIYHGPSTDSPSTNNDLSNINVLKVLVNNTALFDSDSLGNPFNNLNQCSSQMIPANGISNCSVTDTNSASVTVPWSIPGPGSYVILVSVKHKSSEGQDEETLQVSLVTAGYPAPPAVANKYINGVPALKSAAAKVRGCVLNEIARAHGQENRYGPNGGPYDEPLIRSDVYHFWTGICGAQWPAGVNQP